MRRGRRGRVWRTRRAKGRNMYMIFVSTILNCKLAVDKYIHYIHVYIRMCIYNVHPLCTLHTPHTYK